MKLATIDDGMPDGALVIVSRDLTRFVRADGVTTLQATMERWAEVASGMASLAGRLEADPTIGRPFDPASALAPLPRAWQWLDGSAFESHGDLMQTVFGLPPTPRDRPLMYQGMSDTFLAATADVPLPSEADGIDFEGEFGVIIDAVPMGVGVAEAAGHIRLIVQINDWSLRALAPIEMKTGFGWIQAKPASSMAPVAVTPDELGPAWRDGRVDLPLLVDWNGVQFGAASGYAMAFSLPELVAHAARTRSLVAGTVIGTGTVSNADYRKVGSSCIAERRAIELLDEGASRTPFMMFGDRVRMEARLPDDSLLFGAIDQRVVCGGGAR